MNRKNEFEERFQEALTEQGYIRTRTTEEHLERWNYFISECEEGYDDNVDEYDFDLQPRKALEIALQDPVLNTKEEIKSLREQVFEADKRLRDILCDKPIRDPDINPWWMCYVPRFGCREFVEDVYDVYGLSIQTVD
ncbi:hypothetical protein SAMN04487904_10498 [Actinopolyspora lacussalsi subsp. righensis]|uniref:Uncharacterized protein n=1 Tax=Actinopolyspora righensis TaxID=995060 RepID=A0A1I6Z998_9ACTN|nr:hypothetical protein [Actinopolyspora righensis]SFT59233.1 hypothetical protein SAMN04487904_10498 [Actinopolyspora righensis]